MEPSRIYVLMLAINQSGGTSIVIIRQDMLSRVALSLFLHYASSLINVVLEKKFIFK